MITKKELIALGQFIKDGRDSDYGLTDRQVEKLAVFLNTRNPRFMVRRWVGFVKGLNGPNGGRVR